MATKLTKFTKNVNNIQALSDTPNQTEGLSSQGLKERFDRAGTDIKEYLNATLLPEIEAGAYKCDNTFANPLTARSNLKIGYGTTLPSTAENGSIFFLYTE